MVTVPTQAGVYGLSLDIGRLIRGSVSGLMSELVLTEMMLVLVTVAETILRCYCCPGRSTPCPYCTAVDI